MMKPRLLFLCLLLPGWLIAGDHFFKPLYSTVLDSQSGPALLRQCSRSSPAKVKSYWTPVQADLDSLEKNFKKLLSVPSQQCCFPGHSLSNLERYAYQYTGVVINKKKFIYINAFAISRSGDAESRFRDWKTKPVIVCDGGSSYWGVLFCPETGEFSELAFNGTA